MNERKLSIVMLADLIPQDLQGGSARAAWELSREFAARGHAVSLFTRGAKGKPEYEMMEGVEIFRYFLNPFRLRAAVKIYLRSRRPDIIWEASPITSIARFFFDKNVPTVYEFNSPWHEEYEIRSPDLKRGYARTALGSAFRRMVEHYLMAYSDRIVANSGFMAEKIRRYHGLDSDILPLGVDTETFKPAHEIKTIKKKYGIPVNKIILFTLRNLVSRMGIENLVSAVKTVSESNPDVFLIIGGRGYLFNKLRRQIDELGLGSRVRLEGYIAEPAVHEYYQAADIFILPTRFLEGFGLVTLEAMSCGTPVLATPVAANVEILEKFDSTMLFKGTSAEDIGEGINRFIPIYKLQRDEIRQKCTEFIAANFTWRICVNRFERIFYELAKK